MATVLDVPGLRFVCAAVATHLLDAGDDDREAADDPARVREAPHDTWFGRLDETRAARHPVLRWMVSNVQAAQDPAGNEKPDKGKSGDKIDGIVGLIMALSRAIAGKEEEGPGLSDHIIKHGIRTL